MGRSSPRWPRSFLPARARATAIRTVFAVGDAKQSIYSFQRADPQAFLDMRRHFQDRVNAANQDWRSCRSMSRSARPSRCCRRSTRSFAIPRRATGWRSTAATSATSPTAPAMPGWSSCGRRSRPWPPTSPATTTLPVAHRRVAEPYARLARAIAATIASWLAAGERLEARGRPLRPGDVMVLVRRRNEFVGELLRELKRRGVPVAGADRLILTEQLAVQDLVALGRFLLLPEDDLTLAAVLKSPLFDIGEEALFDLCYARDKESLWSRLRVRAGCERGLAPRRRPAVRVARPRRFRPALRALRRNPRRRGRAARAAAAALAPRPKTRSRSSSAWRSPMSASMRRRCKGFLRWLTAGRHRGQARFRGASARRGSHPDRARRQGSRSAGRLSARHDGGCPTRRWRCCGREPDGLPLWKPPGDHVADLLCGRKDGGGANASCRNTAACCMSA